MSSLKLPKHVLQHVVKNGNILGSHEVNITKKGIGLLGDCAGSKQTVLTYNSYNGALTSRDFMNIIPPNVLKDFGTESNEGRKVFDLIKGRDPKYLQFTNAYYLLFRDYKHLNLYYNSTKLERINKVRVNFKITQNSAVIPNYLKYVNTLLAANISSKKYFQYSTGKMKDDRMDIVPAGVDSLEKLRTLVSSYEGRNLLIWNLPNHLKPYDIKNYFWFYDIEDVFKMYWAKDEDSIYHTLHFVKFSNPIDCYKFKQNFHGSYFDDTKNCLKTKLLIETLT